MVARLVRYGPVRPKKTFLQHLLSHFNRQYISCDRPSLTQSPGLRVFGLLAWVGKRTAGHTRSRLGMLDARSGPEWSRRAAAPGHPSVL